MVKIYYWLYIRWLAFLWVFQTNLGNKVWYKGKQYEISNGVRPESWRLPDLKNNDSGWVKRNECKLVLSFSNLRHSYMSGVNFYMTNWYSIWCQNGIKPWMRGCQIWPGRK